MSMITLKKNQFIVFKLSSLAVANSEGVIQGRVLNQILKDIIYLENKFHIRPVIVSSGAVNCGRSIINSKKSSMASLQAMAATGQVLLMNKFQSFFRKTKKDVAQILLTHEDLKSRSRSLNVKNTIRELVANNIIPIINENDTVSFEEISLGDNDQLSATVCEMLGASLLIMLTAANGLFNDDPKNKSAKRIPVVDFHEQFHGKILSGKSAGRGGIRTKLMAVRKLTPIGIPVIVSTYRGMLPLRKAIAGENGTLFLGNPENKRLRKNTWIIARAKTNAHINIDSGAVQALLRNASLLIVGIKSVHGKFQRGDCLAIKHQAKIVAYGMVEFSATELQLMKSQGVSNPKQLLPSAPTKVIIHRNNLVLS